MNVKDFGEYIKNIRLEKNLSLRQVDYMSEITFSNLSMIEHGVRKATPQILKEMARVYELDYIDLLKKNNFINEIEQNILDSQLIKIPILGCVKCGYDYFAEENILGHIEEKPSLVGDGSEYFALKLKGDSMAPAFLDRDIVIVKKQNDCENNEFAIVIINGEEGTLKKVKKTDVGIILQPLNPAYTPLIFTNEEIKNIPIIIVGVVKKLERRF